MRFSRTRIIVLKRSSSNFVVYFLILTQTSKPILLFVLEFLILKTFMNSCHLSLINSHTILTEELEAGSGESKQPAVTAVEVETTTKSCDRQFSDVSTNTEPSTRDPCSRGFWKLFKSFISNFSKISCPYF